MKRKAFTLIELLIVVAIIAILAAIAVPNFLEAQTRAKVSRQQNNLRTMATGLESYMVDNNKYPLTTYNTSPVQRPSGTWELEERWKVWPGFEDSAGGLTTPIAYISVDAMEDVFRFSHNFDSRLANQSMYLPSNFYDVDAYNFTSNSSIYPAQFARYGAWVVRSAGPDTYYQNYLDQRGDYGQGGWNRASYDPTNGTVSSGDIYRSQKRSDEDHD